MPTISEIVKDQHLPQYPTFTKARAAMPSGKVLAEAGQAVQWTKSGKGHQGYVVAIDPTPTRSADGPMILVINKATGRYDQVRLFKLTARKAPKIQVVEPAPEPRSEQAEKVDFQAPPLLSPPSPEVASVTHEENIGKECEPGEIFCSQTVVETPAEQIKGHFAVMEAASLITSHIPGTFREDPRYPKGCQQRDYSLDATEQHKVSRIASRLRPTFLINHTPTAVDGAPIVNKDGIVLGGNGRLMGLKLAYSMGMADNYKSYLMRVAETFGTSKVVIEKFREPVLVRVVDVNMNSCAQYSNILNTGMTQKIGFTDFIVSMSRQLKDNDLAEFGTIIDDADVSTVSQLTNKPASVRAIRDIFSRRNIITQQNMSEFFDPSSPEDFSELGDLLVSRIVLAAILPDKSLIEAATSYTEKVFKVLPTIIKIKALPPKYTFIQDLQEVIRSERKRRRSGLPKQFYLTQGDMFSGGTPQDDLTPEQLTMWDALDSTLGEWKTFVKKYLDSVPKTEITAHRDNMDDLFGSDDDTPEPPAAPKPQSTPKPEEKPQPTPKPEEKPQPTPKPEEKPQPTPKPEEKPQPKTKPAHWPEAQREQAGPAAEKRVNVIIKDHIWFGVRVFEENEDEEKIQIKTPDYFVEHFSYPKKMWVHTVETIPYIWQDHQYKQRNLAWPFLSEENRYDVYSMSVQAYTAEKIYTDVPEKIHKEVIERLVFEENRRRKIAALAHILSAQLRMGRFYNWIIERANERLNALYFRWLRKKEEWVRLGRERDLAKTRATRTKRNNLWAQTGRSVDLLQNEYLNQFNKAPKEIRDKFMEEAGSEKVSTAYRLAPLCNSIYTGFINKRSKDIKTHSDGVVLEKVHFSTYISDDSFPIPDGSHSQEDIDTAIFIVKSFIDAIAHRVTQNFEYFKKIVVFSKEDLKEYERFLRQNK